MKKINLKFILLHFAATILVIGGFENLGAIYNLELLNSLIELGPEKGLDTYSELTGIPPGRALTHLVLSRKIINILGLVLATIASVLVAKKFRISPINSVIIFPIAFLLIRSDILTDLQAPHIFSRPDMSLIFAAIILILTGSFVFFSKWANDWIQNEKTLKKD